MEVLPPLTWGQRPQSCWPLRLFSAPLIHRCLLPAVQQVCDLVTQLFVRRVSVVATVIGSSYRPPITHHSKAFDWPGLPRRTPSKGLWDEMGEKGSLVSVTSQLIENTDIFKKIENFSLKTQAQSKLSISFRGFAL